MLDINNFSSLLEIIIVTNFAFVSVSFRSILDEILEGRFKDNLSKVNSQLAVHEVVMEDSEKKLEKIELSWGEIISNVKDQRKEIEESIEKSKTTHGFSVISLLLALVGLLALFIAGTCCNENILISEILSISIVVVLFVCISIFVKDCRGKVVKTTKRKVIQLQLVLYIISFGLIFYHQPILFHLLESKESMQNITIIIFIALLFIHYPLYYFRMYFVLIASNKSTNQLLKDCEKGLEKIDHQKEVLDELKVIVEKF